MATTLQILRGPDGGSWFLYNHSGRWDGVTNPGSMTGMGGFNGRETSTADVIRAAGLDPEAVVRVVHRDDEPHGIEQVVSFEWEDGREVPPVEAPDLSHISRRFG